MRSNLIRLIMIVTLIIPVTNTLLNTEEQAEEKEELKNLILTDDEVNLAERYINKLRNSSNPGGNVPLGGDKHKIMKVKNSKLSHRTAANKLKHSYHSHSHQSHSHKGRKRRNKKMNIEHKEGDRGGKNKTLKHVIKVDNLLWDDYVDSTKHESMIKHLMKTTTEDPLKKKPKVDHGIEYADYYNDENLPFGSRRIEHSLRNKYDTSLNEFVGNKRFSHDKNKHRKVSKDEKQEKNKAHRGVDELKNLIEDLEKITTNQSKIKNAKFVMATSTEVYHHTTKKHEMSNKETQKVADEILHNLLDSIQDIHDISAIDSAEHHRKEGSPCKLSGSWLTIRSGVKIDMKVTNHAIKANFSKLPHHSKELLFGKTFHNFKDWHVVGQAPFKRGAPFSLIATNNRTKTMAVFLGSCRVCQGIDTIAGIWSIAREPKNCRDVHVATDIYNDIFHKKLHLVIHSKNKNIESETIET